MKNGVKNIQTKGYNGARTVICIPTEKQQTSAIMSSKKGVRKKENLCYLLKEIYSVIILSTWIYRLHTFFIILFFRFAIRICIHTKPKKHPYPPQRCHHVSHIVVKELLNHALFVAFWFLTKLPQTYPPAIDSSF